MKQSRRNFIKTTGLLAGTSLFSCYPNNLFTNKNIVNMKSGKLKLSYKPYTLEMKHVFTISKNSRTTTPIVITEIEFNGLIGYGEASLPPYLPENQETVTAFLSKVDLSKFENPFELENILSYVDSVEEGNTAAKASVDIAMHDLVGKLMNQPWFNIWGFDKSKTPYTSFTIGIDTEEVVRQKTLEAAEFKILKVKLGKETDKMMIETIRSVTNVPICVDVNEGWKDKNFALDKIFWLKEKGCVFVEQPMSRFNFDGNAWITEHSPLPIMADEAVQRLPDVIKAHGTYSGINIKLIKCTGMLEAYKMLLLARSLGMKVMIGCMVETSCAISAASQLSPMADWADLDGALLIKNDLFSGTKVIDGKVTLIDRPGIGIVKN
jgi:L-alanine-DL-glutamate epimerase-like enolase superfamily enzyme